MRLYDKIIERYLAASPRMTRLFTGLVILGFFVTFLGIIPACRATGGRTVRKAFKNTDPSVFIVTGYCNCQKCCSWEYSWFGFGPPVYSEGKLKGKPKKVGLTASGTYAKRGTIAADTKLFPYGTMMEIPGYGRGRVEDIGGAIKGRHIDLWFPTHEEALKWGVKKLKVKVIGKSSKKASGKAPRKKAGKKTVKKTPVAEKAVKNVATTAVVTVKAKISTNETEKTALEISTNKIEKTAQKTEDKTLPEKKK